MGNKDAATALYMKDKHVFADAFNFCLFKGKQVIDPNSLQEVGERDIALPYGSDGVKQSVERVRDVVKVVMTDDKVAYLLLGIENQSNVHYAMPVRNMLYDAMRYVGQMSESDSSHKKLGAYKGANPDEYLSKFKKEDRLLPVITLVVYFGSKPWDGPTTLHEMFREIDPNIKKLIPDYKLNLIAPYAIDDTEFALFNSSLKEVWRLLSMRTHQKRYQRC